jgi:nanoRNase/pAp phosphatase (c-di-AMP/oligoRNAs hydrolase)
MWFDHHVSEKDRVGWNNDVPGESRLAPSAARIIYEYYGGEEKFPSFTEMIKGVDKVDSGNLTADEILNPTGWVLMGFMMDPRTGLGRFRNFRISNYQLMEELIDQMRLLPIEEILENPDVAERIELYKDQNELFKEMVLKHTKVDGNVIITDLRDVSPIYTGNRFLIYSLFPEQNISLWIVDGRGKQNVAIACGYSILKRDATAHVGKLMLEYGGGGHERVGTCQVAYEEGDRVIKELVEVLK